MANQLKQVAEYYDQTLPLYKTFWHRNKSYADHYGYWEQRTRSLSEALINENRFMADVLKIRSGSRILDAGCGIGGSSVWLAENFNVQVIGITISKRQLEKAKELAKKRGLQGKVEFYLQDYLNTKFPDEHFDMIWACESVCYAKNKEDFLAEAYRLLKPRGKIVVADGFLLRDIKQSEEGIYKQFLDGFALHNIAKAANFDKLMRQANFRHVKSWDKTEAVKPSSKIMHRRTLLLYPLVKAMYKLGLVSGVLFKNSLAGIAQYKLVKKGAAGHVVFYGQK